MSKPRSIQVKILRRQEIRHEPKIRNVAVTTKVTEQQLEFRITLVRFFVSR